MERDKKLIEEIKVTSSKKSAEITLTDKGAKLLANKVLDKYKNLFDRLKDA